MTRALTERALRYATQRVEDFALVNRARPHDEKQEAATLWLNYLGLDDDLKLQLGEWLERFLGPGWEGAVLIGLTLGLFVNEYHSDNAESE